MVLITFPICLVGDATWLTWVFRDLLPSWSFSNFCFWSYVFLQISIFTQMPNIEVLTLRLVFWTLWHLWWNQNSWHYLCASTASTASPLFLLWPVFYRWLSFTWGGTKFPPCPSCPICVRCLASGCSGWPRTPAAEPIPDAIASLFCAACLVSKSLIIRVGVNGNVPVA